MPCRGLGPGCDEKQQENDGYEARSVRDILHWFTSQWEFVSRSGLWGSVGTKSQAVEGTLPTGSVTKTEHAEDLS